MKGQRTLESWMMANGKIGDVFYTNKKDKDITAIASYYNRKIKTERVLAISGDKSTPELSTLVKVILN